MTYKEDAAFPVSLGTTGLTKREFFAAMALAGMCASKWADEWSSGTTIEQDQAKAAVRRADALIEELNKDL